MCKKHKKSKLLTALFRYIAGTSDSGQEKGHFLIYFSICFYYNKKQSNFVGKDVFPQDFHYSCPVSSPDGECIQQKGQKG